MYATFFTNPVTNWLLADGPTYVLWVMALGMVAAYAYLRPGKEMHFAGVVLLAFGFLARASIAAYQTAAQYWLWTQESFTQLFLPPHQPISYFVGYVTQQFWMGLILATILAVAWYVFLRVLRARTDRFFDEGEIVLATLAMFVIGWPGVVVLLPLAGVALVVVSVVRTAVFKEQLTTLGIPFLIAMLVTLLFRAQIMAALGIELY